MCGLFIGAETWLQWPWWRDCALVMEGASVLLVSVPADGVADSSCNSCEKKRITQFDPIQNDH